MKVYEENAAVLMRCQCVRLIILLSKSETPFPLDISGRQAPAHVWVCPVGIKPMEKPAGNSSLGNSLSEHTDLRKSLSCHVAQAGLELK